MSLSGLKDIDREVLKHVDDRELLQICKIDRKTWNDVCDDNFIRRRLSKYPGIEKYKKDTETWKEFFLRAIYYISKMMEDYKFQYISGDFKKQYQILIYKDINDVLERASNYGFLDLVKHAVKNSATNFDIALAYAADSGHLNLVKYLHSLGADIHANQQMALRYASFGGHLDVVKYLVERGADLDPLDVDSPVVFAARAGRLDIVKYFLDQGISDNLKKQANFAAKRAGMMEVSKYLESSLV